jgi:hypothetical protein
MTPDPTQPTPDNGATPENSPAEEITAPLRGASLRATERILDVLRAVPGGAEVDEYYGVSSGVPKQSAEEAARGEELVAGLSAFSEGQGDFSALFDQIQRHNETSEIDPELLRSLMRSRNKQVE